MNINFKKSITILTLLNIAITSGFSPNVKANPIIGEPTSEFSIIAGNKVYLNSSGDFEGDINDPSDDALIYAHNGFTMNNLSSTNLPTKKDSSGNVLTDASNLKILVDNAVAINSSFPEINAPNNPYSGLDPAPQVSEQIISLPNYEDLKIDEKNKRNAGTNSVTFNPSSNPINNLSDWNSLFPAPGSSSQPSVVNVIGNLNIPDGVSLNNYIITVDGTINFNGVSTLDNTVLIVNNGGINLGATQFNNSAVFAPNTINMNSSATFSGSSLIASLNDVNFDGATVTTYSEDELTIITQGTITYNASLDSRGSFLSGNDVNFNSNTILHGFIAAQNDIRCNSSCAIVGINQNVSNNNNVVYAD